MAYVVMAYIVMTLQHSDCACVRVRAVSGSACMCAFRRMPVSHTWYTCVAHMSKGSADSIAEAAARAVTHGQSTAGSNPFNMPVCLHVCMRMSSWPAGRVVVVAAAAAAAAAAEEVEEVVVEVVMVVVVRRRAGGQRTHLRAHAYMHVRV